MAEVEEKGKWGGEGGWKEVCVCGGGVGFQWASSGKKKKEGIKVCSARWGWTWRAQSGDVLVWSSLASPLMPALCLA